MKVFISYSSKDKDAVTLLAHLLRARGHHVFAAYESIPLGASYADTIMKELNQSDLLVAIITETYLNSPYCQAELSSAVFSDKGILICPVLVGNVFAPSYLDGGLYWRAENIQQVPSIVLEQIARYYLHHEASAKLISRDSQSIKKNDTKAKIEVVRKAFNQKNLTLVCGTGVSMASTVPSWDELLTGLLKTCIPKINDTIILDVLPHSNIIIGKYLRNLLGSSFDESVRDQLYQGLSDEAINTPLLRAIARLSQPNRHGVCLDSIITYNYDNLVERKLDSLIIPYTSIWKERQIPQNNTLPIYHVHGYLPHTEALDEPNLVLSEEAYHSQYIDPYCWSNLIQLNTFSSKVCLFVGNSLTDPNMRRLLDITYRKKNEQNHFIILKRPLTEGKDAELAASLIEQDANSLGINVIWCIDYNEIPGILEQFISET